jgi:V8-like Glu-specific endopeptidase
MRNRIRRIGVAAAAVALFAPLAAGHANQLTVSRTVSPQEQAAAATYWTRERIAAAPALPMPVDRTGSASVLAPDQERSVGAPASSPPHTAAWDADFVAQSHYWQDWVPAEDGAALEPDPLAPEGTPSVYTHYNVNNNNGIWNIYPHKWDGKLTFLVPGGSASCSATVISGNNIVTAAHCVYDTTSNFFYSGWVFTPAYRPGGMPYGTFTASVCTVLTTWVNLTGSFSIATWSRHDVAVCTLNTNTAGQTINNAVGWAGRLWNAANTQLVFNSGYPARYYTDVVVNSGPGEYLRSCTAETFLYTTETLGSGCFWGRGISGGSWLVKYQPFLVSGHVNSVNSGLFIGQQNLYGARFNSNNIVPLCTARSC